MPAAQARGHYLLKEGVPLEPCALADAIPAAWYGTPPHSSGDSRGGGSDRGYQLPGTAAVQMAIWRHQHPANCSAARLLVYRPEEIQGLGALVDFLSAYLAAALETGRVLLADLGGPWTRGERGSYCHGGALPFDACYFEPLSSCSLRDVYCEAAVHAVEHSLDLAPLAVLRRPLHGEHVWFGELLNKTEGPIAHPLVPTQFRNQSYFQGVRLGELIGGVASEIFRWRAQASQKGARQGACLAQGGDVCSASCWRRRHGGAVLCCIKRLRHALCALRLQQPCNLSQSSQLIALLHCRRSAIALHASHRLQHAPQPAHAVAH